MVLVCKQCSVFNTMHKYFRSFFSDIIALYSCIKAAITNHHKLRGLKCILTSFWKPDQGFGKIVIYLKLVKNLPTPSFQWPLPIHCLCSITPSLPSFSMAFYPAFHILSYSLKTPVIGFRTHAKSRIISSLGPKLSTTVKTLCSHSDIPGEQIFGGKLLNVLHA